MHIFEIYTNASILSGNWLWYFLIIEIPISVYLVFNIAFLCCFNCITCQRIVLRLRYFVIDAFFVITCGGLVAMIILYV